jgi:hypothetical protein
MILTGFDATLHLKGYTRQVSPDLRGKEFAYMGLRRKFINNSLPRQYHWFTQTLCGTGLNIDLMNLPEIETLRIYTQDFPLPEDSSGAVNGSLHKPENGEITMSRNTTIRLFKIANFNLGSVVKKQGVEYLVAGFRGFYQNARISTYSSDDVTSIPPTDNPTVEYQLLGHDGRTVVARKADLTLVRSHAGIHEKYELGTANAYRSAKDDLEELKADWVRVRTPVAPPAPVAAPAPEEAPASQSVLVSTDDGITATVQFDGSAEDLYNKLERLVG